MATKDTELLLYHSARLQLVSIWQVALITLALSYVLVAVDALPLAGAVVFCTIFLVGGARGIEKGGRVRAAYERLPGIEYTYPPLSEWKEQLESEGAFEEVRYGD